METGPNRLVEMAHIAREHYVNDVSMVDLADRTGMSRFRVARLLTEARERGVLRISVGEPQVATRDELAEFRELYGLREVRCAAKSEANAAGTEGTGDDDAVALRDALGRAAAGYLEENVREGEVLGFASGRTLGAIATHLNQLPACDVVQLTGLSGPPGETAVDLVRTVSAVSGGATAPLYIPLVASDDAAADTFRRQPGVASTLARMTEVTRAVLAVGSWVPAASQLVSSISAEETDGLVTRGVRADIAASLFDADGARIAALDDRTIAIPFEQLRHIPEIAIVAGGAEKREALRAVLRAGFATALITDHATVLALLDER